MCVDFPTSIIAFSIGFMTGLLLINQKDIEKQSIGKFIICYSLIQLVEAGIHKYPDQKNLIARLLPVLLAFQGVCFANLYREMPRLLMMIFYLIFIFATIRALSSKSIGVEIRNSIHWNFPSNINYPIGLMYVLIFLFIFSHFHTNSFTFRYGLIMLFTYVFSHIFKNVNRGSYWCMISALGAPIALVI